MICQTWLYCCTTFGWFIAGTHVESAKCWCIAMAVLRMSCHST